MTYKYIVNIRRKQEEKGERKEGGREKQKEMNGKGKKKR